MVEAISMFLFIMLAFAIILLIEASSVPDYDELLKAAQAMHTWIFLHSGDESMIYKECGLSDEMNAFLGYSGSFTFAVPVEEED